jgi:GNAT superfamily N-acetyltransferase
VTAYRFCRTDDIGLLVEALNRCWAPYFPDEPPITAPEFKRSIRDLQVWCSSCMVAFSGSDPIGVLIGAKRPSSTLVHRIAVHPDHLRLGHGRHLLDSLGSKLAILGPPRIVAEVPEAFEAACGLFGACGYVEEAMLTDYVLSGACPEPSTRSGTGFVIPVTIDDLAANGLDPSAPSGGHAQPPACWERAAETLGARKDDLAGLAVATDEGIEAYLLYRGLEWGVEVAAFRSLIDDGGDRLVQLVSALRTSDLRSVRFPRVYPAEIPAEWLERLGFKAAARYRLFAGIARPG